MNKWIPKAHRRVILLIVGVFLLTACASSPKPLEIRSDVDALATSDAQSKRHFVIFPANKEIKQQDLEFIEFKTYVEKVLSKRGFVKANTPQDGDVVLLMNYGVSEPQTYQYSYDVPAWYGFGGTYPYFRRSWYYPMSPYYTQRIETYLMYRRFLSLEAYDMEAYLQNKTPVQLWKINVQSQGLSNDLRLVFPYMVVAMEPYLGTNTGHMVTIDVNELNPLLKSLLFNQPDKAALSPAKPQ